MAGAVLIELPSMYPAAPATIHPTTNPTMILMFLRNGEPKSSVRMMLTKDRNPRPMNSGEPQLLTFQTHGNLVARGREYEGELTVEAGERGCSDRAGIFH